MKLAALLATAVVSALLSRAAVAQDGSAPWPLERQDRWGTARALTGLPAAQLTTPWVYRRISTHALVSHGASLGPNGIGYFGNWQGFELFKFNYNTGDILGTFNALHFVGCTPAIASINRVYASTDTPAGHIFAIDTNLMDYDWFKTASYASSPNVGPDGDIVSSTFDGRVYRLDETAGGVVWERTGLGETRGPVVFRRDDLAVFVASGTKITCLDYADGDTIWEKNIGSAPGIPGVAPDGTVVAGSQSGTVYGLDPVDGDISWTWPTLDEVRAAPAFSADGVAYVCGYDRRLYALRTSDGFRLWSFTGSGRATTPPVVDVHGRIYFHNQERDIYCVNPQGQQVWRVNMMAQTRGPMTIGPDNTLYVGCSDGRDGLAIIRQFAVDAELNSVNIERGSIISGGLAQVLSSDDAYLRMRPGVTLVSTEAPVRVLFALTSPRPQIESFSITLETAASSASIRQWVEVYNFVTNEYETLDTRQATILDSTIRIDVTSNATRFSSGAGQMRIRVNHKASQPVLSYPWNSRFDLVNVKVVPKFIP